jgi:hypothetical protein
MPVSHVNNLMDGLIIPHVKTSFALSSTQTVSVLERAQGGSKYKTIKTQELYPKG